MPDTISPEPGDAQAPQSPPAEDQLDGFEKDLDSVTAALDALDADDVVTAESIVEQLAATDDCAAPDSDAGVDS